MGERIKVLHLFKGVSGAIGQDSAIRSEAIDMRDKRLLGNFSLHFISVGGTITVTVEVCSTKDGTFIAPNTGITVADGIAAGTYFEAFSPPAAAFMKLLFTETDVAPVTSMNAWLNMQ